MNEKSLIELKAEAYDRYLQIEQHQAEINKLAEELRAISAQIQSHPDSQK